ncbi:MAG: glycine zipper 2TM domain-containing protein [Rickettsiales bacterium]
MRYSWMMVAASVLALAACEKKRDQNTYFASEVGVSHVAEFGTVRKRRDVTIEGKNSGNGTLLGAGTGAGAGSYIGQSDGNVWATAGTAIAGAVAGRYIEDALTERDGIEYTLQMQSGAIKTIVQEKDEDVPEFNVGQHIMLTQCDAGNEQVKRCAAGSQFQRLTAVDHLPKTVIEKHGRRTREKYDDYTPDNAN